MAFGRTLRAGWHTGGIVCQCAIQTRANVSAGRIDARGDGRAGGIREGTLIHVVAGEAVTCEALQTGARIISHGVGAECIGVARTHFGALIYVRAM